MTNELIEAMRTAFDEWYVRNAFDYERNPIGSREHELQWRSWRAALAAAESAGYRLVPGWVPVSERLPDTNAEFGESDYVLVCAESGTPFVGWYSSNVKAWRVAHHYATSEAVPAVTHWMPLPAPPDHVADASKKVERAQS